MTTPKYLEFCAPYTDDRHQYYNVKCVVPVCGDDDSTIPDEHISVIAAALTVLLKQDHDNISNWSNSTILDL